MVLKDWNDKNNDCFKVIIQVNLELKYFAEAKFSCQQPLLSVTSELRLDTRVVSNCVAHTIYTWYLKHLK